MTWLIVTILAYFFFAIVALFDRYLLVGPLPHPKVYAFYVGVLGMMISLILIPFGFEILSKNSMIFALFAGMARIFAIWVLFLAIFKSEVSRVIPAVGGFLPIFTFLLFLIFLPTPKLLNPSQILAFLSLLAGSVLISSKEFNLKFLSFVNLKFPLLAAVLFAFEFFLMKQVYLSEPFIPGFIWMRFGGAIPLLFFLISTNTRKLIFEQKPIVEKRVFLPFIVGQGLGALAFLLQNLAVFLAKPGQVPLINALEGTKYVFLLLFVFILFKKFPQLLKEEMGGKILFQKIIAIILIILGLFILTQS